jgi:hypothetical protein
MLLDPLSCPAVTRQRDLLGSRLFLERPSSVLPWGAWRHHHLLNPDRSRRGDPGERVSAIVDVISRCLIPRTRLPELLRRLRGDRMIRDHHVHNPTTLVREDH